jgi:hypothetical protein
MKISFLKTILTTSAVIGLCVSFLYADSLGQSQLNQASTIRIHAFWTWFIQNESRFKDLEDDRDVLVPEIVDHLRVVSQNLTVEIQPPTDGVRAMAISADGIEKDFPLVEQVVAVAPSMHWWRIVAFRQPERLKGMKLEFPGDPKLVLEVDKMWFRPIENEDGLSLIIFFPNYRDKDRSVFINASYILLDDAIGEYDVVKGIKTLDFQMLPALNARNGILPFADLPKVFADYRNKFKH